MDYGRPTGTNGPSGSVTDSEMMRVTPIWEQRGKKKKGFGRAASAAPAAAEPRTFDEPMPTSPMDAPRVESDPMAHTAAHERRIDMQSGSQMGRDEPGLIAPAGRVRAKPSPRRSSIAPAAVAAGVVALVGVGAAGWYASRGDDGVPELTPGSAGPAAVASADLPAVDLPAEPATGETATRTTTVRAEAPMEAPRATTRIARATPRARPAAAASASTSGIDASTSATLPAGPQPYSSVNPSAAAAPEPIPAAPAPAQAAPPPVTTEPAPQPAPETPPQQPATEPEPPM
jgi:hypothetical protein